MIHWFSCSLASNTHKHNHNHTLRSRLHLVREIVAAPKRSPIPSCPTPTRTHTNRTNQRTIYVPTLEASCRHHGARHELGRVRDHDGPATRVSPIQRPDTIGAGAPDRERYVYTRSYARTLTRTQAMRSREDSFLPSYRTDTCRTTVLTLTLSNSLSNSCIISYRLESSLAQPTPWSPIPTSSLEAAATSPSWKVPPPSSAIAYHASLTTRPLARS